MNVDIAAAEYFVHANARTVDRHRLAVLLDEAPPEPTLRALRAYQNADGGFGHALEPDIRDSASQPAAVLHALEAMSAVGALDHPMVTEAAEWVASISLHGGAVPMACEPQGNPPRAPFMKDATSDAGSFLTFAISGFLYEAGYQSPWLEQATAWCWEQIDRPDERDAYWVKFALDFLDRVPEPERASVAIEGLRHRLHSDGSIPVSGGVEGERVTPLDLSGRPGCRSRVIFTHDQIDADLDRLAAGQLDDGGWDFEFLHWSPGQSIEWRGATTVRALATLAAHGRLERRAQAPA